MKAEISKTIINNLVNKLTEDEAKGILNKILYTIRRRNNYNDDTFIDNIISLLTTKHCIYEVEESDINIKELINVINDKFQLYVSDEYSIEIEEIDNIDQIIVVSFKYNGVDTIKEISYIERPSILVDSIY